MNARLAPSLHVGDVCSLVEARASETPGAVYAVSLVDGRILDFGELAASCRRIRRLMTLHGLQAGATVSVIMPNGLQTLRVLVGAMYAGLVVNPINLLSQPAQMGYVLGHADCGVVVVAPEWEERVQELVAGLDRKVVVIVADPEGPALPGERDAMPDTVGMAPSPGHVALLMYTSGTTGVPKGVMLTHGNLVANAFAIANEHRLDQHDRVLAVLPLYHINAFMVTMLAPLVSGGSLAMPAKFSAARFWAQAEGCTWINVVPTMISYLLEGETPPRAQTASIRFCRSASAALPPEQHRAFEQRFGIGIIETMGLTETAAPSFSNPLDASARKLGSVGRASGCEACVLDASLQPVADGVVGELAIRGPNVMVGYYKNEVATSATLTPAGWLRTGDLGMRDVDGFFFVTGRIKELIIKGGENIAPREIDEVLLAHPSVLDAASVGIPDPHYGQEIMACVVLRKGTECDEESLRRFCIERLGRFKTPKVLHFVDDLPRGPSGKVQRLKLIDWVA